MADAGCINAYDNNGCFLQTIDTLNSEDVGQDVCYRFPNIGNREVDYVCYKDKCGCSCRIDGENEFIIHATQGVLNAITLTQNNTNQTVNVKWSELFGGNWKKTVVRYKIGGYPVSEVDGTLAVEELIQNQYATNGYNVSGLADATTYYFRAFAIAQDDTVIQIQSGTITTDFGLPSTYQQLVYIQSTGSQYIDSGYTVKTTTKTQADFAFTAYVQGNRIEGYSADSGSVYSTGITRGWYLGDSASKIKFGIGNGSNQSQTWNNPLINASTNRYLFIGENGKATIKNIDGSQVASVNTQYTITQNATHSMGIFSSRDMSYNTFRNYPQGRLYGYKIRENGTLVCDFIPCYRKSDNVIGLYDLKRKTFHINSGSGTFVKGPEYKKIPNTYQQIEFIQTSATNPGSISSSGQVIDTGVIATPNTKMEINLSFDNLTTQSRLFGVITNNSSYATFVSYINGSSQRARAFKDGEGNWIASSISVDNNRHIRELDKNGYRIYTNGSQVYNAGNNATPTRNTQHTVPLFCHYSYTEGNKYCDHSSLKCYYCKMYENGTVVRRFVPCYRKSDNVAGLYDCINNVFYTNVGTGSFTKGPKVG